MLIKSISYRYKIWNNPPLSPSEYYGTARKSNIKIFGENCHQTSEIPYFDFKKRGDVIKTGIFLWQNLWARIIRKKKKMKRK
jgi:hypothetical protein